MKPVLIFATAALALAAAPALADNGQVFDFGAQSRAYPSGERLDARQCFNGKAVSGVNRAGASTLYVQSRRGGIYDLQLSGACGALDSARKISVRSNGGDAVCEHGVAEVVVQTPAGAMRCGVSQVRQLTARETAKLAAAARR